MIAFFKRITKFVIPNKFMFSSYNQQSRYQNLSGLYANDNFINKTYAYENNVAFCKYGSQEQLSDAEILQRFKQFKPVIKDIHIIKNRLGENSGKLILTFINQLQRNNFLAQFQQKQKHEKNLQQKDNNNNIQFFPFNLRNQNFSAQNNYNNNVQKKIKQVKISNLDNQLTHLDVKKIVEDFGQVVDIKMEFKHDGNNKGYAIIQFNNTYDALEFYKAIQGMLHLGRKIRATLIIKQKQIKEQSSQKSKEQQNARTKELYADILRRN